MKDEFYKEARENAREMVNYGFNSTQEQVEAHAEKLRYDNMIENLGKIKITERPPAAYRYEY